MLTFSQVKKNPQVLEFIHQTEIALGALGYGEHGLRHSRLVADRARNIAKETGLTKRQQELSAIAGFCHDMGNFLGRTQHHYWGAFLFHEIFSNEDPVDVSVVMQAIANHDKSQEMKLTNPVSAVVVIADKSDVHRSRVRIKDIKNIKSDIHDRVNYAVMDSKVKIDKKKKKIILSLKVDRKIISIMEYFEIFIERMAYCRRAAKFLGYKFSIVINKIDLL